MSEEAAEGKVDVSAGEDVEGITVRDIGSVPVNVSAVLGRSVMTIGQVLSLRRGAVVELDRKVGDHVEVYLNNKLIAFGEVVIVEDRVGVTLTEVIADSPRGSDS